MAFDVFHISTPVQCSFSFCLRLFNLDPVIQVRTEKSGNKAMYFSSCVSRHSTVRDGLSGLRAEVFSKNKTIFGLWLSDI